MIRDIVSCQGSSISSAIVRKIFHHILKREGMFYVVVLIDKLQSFVSEEVTIGLLGVQSMCQSKLIDDSNYITYFLFHKIRNSMSINKYSKFLTCMYLQDLIISDLSTNIVRRQEGLGEVRVYFLFSKLCQNCVLFFLLY